MSDNTITIIGNLADDAELRFTQNGIAVASFVVMQTKRIKRGDDFVDGAKNGLRVTVWRDQAENVAESLRKGTHVIVTGQLEPQQWQDRESGADRYGWGLTADHVGVGLKYATAQAQKADRRANAGGGGGYSSSSSNGAQGGYGGGRQGGGDADSWAGAGNQGGYDDPPF